LGCFICFVLLLLLLLLLFFSPEVGRQGIHLEPLQQPFVVIFFFVWFFSRKDLVNYLTGWLWIAILLISASRIARIHVRATCTQLNVTSVLPSNKSGSNMLKGRHGSTSYNPPTWKGETGKLWVWSQPGLHSKTLSQDTKTENKTKCMKDSLLASPHTSDYNYL
jgi:hypothetical protein